jgi:hypothetical protein
VTERGTSAAAGLEMRIEQCRREVEHPDGGG